MKTFIPETYKTVLDTYDTQTAIGVLKRTFEDKLSKNLNLKRVTAPLFVTPESGLNDDLNGFERAVSFDILETKTLGVVVHSLAKWKRMALHRYGFKVGEGIYTDMNAIRRDEEMDNLHSIYVDQWDWEKIIDVSDRNFDYLMNTVQAIVDAIVDTSEYLKSVYPALTRTIERKVKFITSQELEDKYPDKTSKERENLIAKEYKTVFIMQIGGALKSGKPHDGRAPDYDDWELNGDLLFYNETMDMAIEISSMGIRVSPQSLDKQLKISNHDERRNYEFHRLLLDGKLPYTIGGGIGQSRLSLLLLEKAHVGEVQVSIWDEQTIAECKAKKVNLL